jgi:hypothetical protein
MFLIREGEVGRIWREDHLLASIQATPMGLEVKSENCAYFINFSSVWGLPAERSWGDSIACMGDGRDFFRKIIANRAIAS